ncbi:MAG: ribonuclease D [Gammaproteobacteria bacterium]|nr:ribonuclease D [Gammaproteobacteria bacterium]
MTTESLSLPKEINDSYTLVIENETFQQLCQEWKSARFLAIDTEFIRTTTFYPHVGLIQINDGTDNTLIDPLTINDWGPFCELLQDKALVKIMHSCSEDLQVFMTAMKIVPEPVFDTQIAAGLLNAGFGCSYQTLVKNILDIDLLKGETRSDWLQRPLSGNQCHYAALDVAFLPAIYQHQKSALEQSDRLSWLEEECELLTAQYREELAGDYSDYFLNFRGAWQLNKEELGVLRQLAQWRELRARKRDKPRNWIVKDKQLVEIAKLGPGNLEKLQEIDDLGNNFLRHEGEEIIQVVKHALAIPKEKLPELLPKPLDGKDKQRLKNGQQFAEQKATEMGLPTEILIRKRWLVSLLQNMRDQPQRNLENDSEKNNIVDFLPVELTGWRESLLLPELIEALK